MNIEREDCGTHYSWLINTTNRWCRFVIQKYYYDEVCLEEYDEYDGVEVISVYKLLDYPKKSQYYINQEKDQIEVICIK